MTGRNLMVFVMALLAWAGVFYLIDMSIMQAQGLPVGVDLMPQ